MPAIIRERAANCARCGFGHSNKCTCSRDCGHEVCKERRSHETLADFSPKTLALAASLLTSETLDYMRRAVLANALREFSQADARTIPELDNG
jgi:hypothetical protein